MTLLRPGQGRRRSRIGARELAALALLVTTGIFYVFELRPAEQRLAALDRSVAMRANRIPLMLAGDSSEKSVHGRQLGAFYAFFDRQQALSDWLARFYALAEHSGIELQQADYRRSEPIDIPLATFEISSPVTGDYARIRAFAEGVLANIPVASLDGITFRRQRANQALIEAELRFTLYLPTTAK